MKAVVTLITLVIIFAIIVAFGLLLWLYISGYFTQIRQAGELRTEKSLETLSSCIKIEEVFQNKFFIRNCGTGLITNDTLDVYIDDELFDFDLDPISIDGGKTGSIILNGVWGLSIGQHSLKIINPNTEALVYFEAELADSAVLALDFDEGSGNITYDKSGYGGNGILGGGSCNPGSASCPQWADGKFGNALDFDGNDDYVKVPSSEYIKYRGGDMTAEVWVWVDNIESEGHIINKAWNAANRWNYYIFFNTGNKLKVYVGGGDGITIQQYSYITTKSITKEEWHHLVVVLSASDLIKIYVDGELFEETTYTVTQWDPPGGDTNYDMSLGTVYEQTIPLFNFNGIMDSIRIYNKALTPAETLNFRII